MTIPDVNRDFDAALAAFTTWYVHEAPALRSPRTLVRETCEKFVEYGVPLQRFTAFILTLHPDYFGVAHRWWRGGGEVKTGFGNHAIWNTAVLQNSPVRLIHDGAAAVRRRLVGPHAVIDYKVLDEYIAEGATDYVLMHLPFSDGGRHAVALSTDRGGGFSVAELRLVDAMLPHMARLSEVLTVRHFASVLLDTYVGRQSGAEILAGNIRRGTGRTLRAVILMSDLEGFTALSERLPRDQLIALLNAYFDRLGGPVNERGGEILKFIGDAMLAIFPVAETDPASAGRAALAALAEAAAANAAAAAERAAAGLPAIRFGAGLHIGDVMYGNIGTRDRLDFTVIGPAVNLASRIEGLTRTLGAPVLVSADFVAASGIAARSLGRHTVKGLADPIEVFTPGS